MENINLADIDYVRLLAEIESDEDELKEKEEKQELEELEEQEEEQKAISDAYYKRPAKAAAKQNLTRAIKQMAFNQNDIDLNDLIGQHNMQTIIDLSVQRETRKADIYKEFINKRITSLLKPFIPASLMRLWAEYPSAFFVGPGFLYKAGAEYGGGLLFWAIPNLPYYIAQGQEMDILNSYDNSLLHSIDRAVLKYSQALKLRSDKEIKNASFIIRKGIRTYFDLLKFKPTWFNMFYKNLKAE